MTKIRSGALLGAIAAAAIFAASPSFALVAWQCTAKDSRGHEYTQQTWGLFTIDTRAGAKSFALDKCEKNSSRPATCEIKTCIKTHA